LSIAKNHDATIGRSNTVRCASQTPPISVTNLPRSGSTLFTPTELGEPVIYWRLFCLHRDSWDGGTLVTL